jgi:hypothetical protein
MSYGQQQQHQQQQQRSIDNHSITGPVLQMNSNVGMTGLALGPPQSASTSTAMVDEWRFRRQESFGRMFNSNATPEVTEDELRARSLELLENEDMHTQIQQLLRMYNGQVGDIIPFSPYPDTDFPIDVGATAEEAVGEHKPPTLRANGKAYVGWLKLKAALHWGIFIRKRAAARRANQLEEDS